MGVGERRLRLNVCLRGPRAEGLGLVEVKDNRTLRRVYRLLRYRLQGVVEEEVWAVVAEVRASGTSSPTSTISHGLHRMLARAVGPFSHHVPQSTVARSSLSAGDDCCSLNLGKSATSVDALEVLEYWGVKGGARPRCKLVIADHKFALKSSLYYCCIGIVSARVGVGSF